MLATYLLIDVLIAYIIDLIAGDPYWLPHPVRFIGRLVKKSESFLRRFTSKTSKENVARSERIAGVILMIAVVAATFLIVFAILRNDYKVSSV